MDSNKIIEQYLAISNSVTQTNQNEVKLENVKPIGDVASDQIVFWGITGFAVCWVAIFFMLSKRVRFARKEIAVNIKVLHQIPCKNCKFYSSDPHLKCAVNPSTVLTEKAIDCSDYTAKENKLS
ncbi:hypothetical protein [Synechocystis sp. PCC 7509]|uniref:hypothetical protein n=1 Tax=Synechocystis sp. PCC 7509 TaxID=927677 RepID=UPI0002ACB0B4|nr:hypothetical protein [Synechocystis sp. PCC 7509]